MVFGNDVDEYFYVWYIGCYVDEIVVVGQVIKDLFMNVNVVLCNLFNFGDGYFMGGLIDNVIDLWKVVVLYIDMIFFDIYFCDYKIVIKVFELYVCDDNLLFVVEIGNDQFYVCYFFFMLGEQGIGFVLFGMDYIDYVNFLLGVKLVIDEVIVLFVDNYVLFGFMVEVWVVLLFIYLVWGFVEFDVKVMSGDVWNVKGISQVEFDIEVFVLGEYFM